MAMTAHIVMVGRGSSTRKKRRGCKKRGKRTSGSMVEERPWRDLPHNTGGLMTVLGCWRRKEDSVSS